MKRWVKRVLDDVTRQYEIDRTIVRRVIPYIQKTVDNQKTEPSTFAKSFVNQLNELYNGNSIFEVTDYQVKENYIRIEILEITSGFTYLIYASYIKDEGIFNYTALYLDSIQYTTPNLQKLRSICLRYIEYLKKKFTSVLLTSEFQGRVSSSEAVLYDKNTICYPYVDHFDVYFDLITNEKNFMDTINSNSNNPLERIESVERVLDYCLDGNSFSKSVSIVENNRPLISTEMKVVYNTYKI